MNTPSSNTWLLVILFLITVGLMVLALSGYLNPVISAGLNPILSVQGWLSTRYTTLYEFVTIPRDSNTLRVRNDELENQVASLQSQVIQLQQQLREAETLYSLLNFARRAPQNQYVAASVIGRDPSPFLHYLIIDHGSDDGLRHGMPVVTQQGLVGRVAAVTANAARVQMITDPGSAVNVYLQSNETNLILRGSLTGELELNLIPQDLEIPQGDIVLTSGLGGNFPPDILIGQVVSLLTQETDLFQTATVQPAIDYSTLQAVLVIVNYRPIDIEPLIPTIVP